MPVRFLFLAIAAVCVLPLFSGQAQAGYLSASLASLDDVRVPAQVIVELEGGAGAVETEGDANIASDSDSSDPTRPHARPVGSLTSGGMSAPADGANVTGQFAGVAAVEVLPSSETPMVAWLGAEGRSALPNAWSTGIFRPPRPVSA